MGGFELNIVRQSVISSKPVIAYHGHLEISYDGVFREHSSYYSDVAKLLGEGSNVLYQKRLYLLDSVFYRLITLISYYNSLQVYQNKANSHLINHLLISQVHNIE